LAFCRLLFGGFLEWKKITKLFVGVPVFFWGFGGHEVRSKIEDRFIGVSKISRRLWGGCDKKDEPPRQEESFKILILITVTWNVKVPGVYIWYIYKTFLLKMLLVLLPNGSAVHTVQGPKGVNKKARYVYNVSMSSCPEGALRQRRRLDEGKDPILEMREGKTKPEMGYQQRSAGWSHKTYSNHCRTKRLVSSTTRMVDKK
jgi:hypothetical protein